MSRTTKYLMQRFKITEKEAKNVLSDMEDERLKDYAENMFAFYGLDKLAATLDDETLVHISALYEDMISEDTGEIEQKAIEIVLGKSIEELQMRERDNK